MKAAGYVHLLWLAAFGVPVWGATIASVVLAVLAFRYG
jgi:predicted small integral membrane protein